MLFGWWVELGISSNSVIYVKDRATVGIGTGEQDRVGVAEIARDKAYRKMADLICFEEQGVPIHELKDDEVRESIEARVREIRGGPQPTRVPHVGKSLLAMREASPHRSS